MRKSFISAEIPEFSYLSQGMWYFINENNAGRPLDTHFLIHSSTQEMSKKKKKNPNWHFEKIYKHRSTNWKRWQGGIWPFNVIQNQRVLLSEVGCFLEADEKIAPALWTKVLTILTKKMNFSQRSLNMCAELSDICNVKIFHGPWLFFSVPCKFQIIPNKHVRF